MGLSRPRRKLKSSSLLWPDSQRQNFSFPLAVYLLAWPAMGHQCQVQRGLEPRRPLVLACGVEQTRKWGERPQRTVPTPAKQTCKRTKV